MPKRAKKYMSGQFVAYRGEQAGLTVTKQHHKYVDSYTIHDDKGNSLTVPDRPLSPSEQQASSAWFAKFIGFSLLAGLVAWGLMQL